MSSSKRDFSILHIAVKYVSRVLSAIPEAAELHVKSDATGSVRAGRCTVDFKVVGKIVLDFPTSWTQFNEPWRVSSTLLWRDPQRPSCRCYLSASRVMSEPVWHARYTAGRRFDRRCEPLTLCSELQVRLWHMHTTTTTTIIIIM